MAVLKFCTPVVITWVLLVFMSSTLSVLNSVCMEINVLTEVKIAANDDNPAKSDGKVNLNEAKLIPVMTVFLPVTGHH